MSTASFTAYLDSVAAALVLLAFVASVVGLLEHTHRRALRLGGGPLGRDAGTDRDLTRTLADLRAAAPRADSSAVIPRDEPLCSQTNGVRAA